MSLSFDRAFGPYEAALKLRGQRAEVLSGNLANTDTPNFQARDFDFQAALQNQLGKSTNPQSVKTTHAAHLTLPGMGAKDAGPLLYRVPSQPSIDGNTVDEHIEHAEFMANNLEFETAFTLLNSRIKGLLSAIRGE